MSVLTCFMYTMIHLTSLRQCMSSLLYVQNNNSNHNNNRHYGNVLKLRKQCLQKSSK